MKDESYIESCVAQRLTLRLQEWEPIYTALLLKLLLSNVLHKSYLYRTIGKLEYSKKSKL